MTAVGHLIAIDQGTTSTRAIVFDAKLAPIAAAQQELRQIYPAPGWVEHDPRGHLDRCRSRPRGQRWRRPAPAPRMLPRIGITNQRETTIVWDRADRQADPQRDRLAGPAHRTMPARRCVRAGHEKLRQRAAPACCSIRISRRRKSPGCSTT